MKRLWAVGSSLFVRSLAGGPVGLVRKAVAVAVAVAAVVAAAVATTRPPSAAPVYTLESGMAVATLTISRVDIRDADHRRISCNYVDRCHTTWNYADHRRITRHMDPGGTMRALGFGQGQSTHRGCCSRALRLLALSLLASPGHRREAQQWHRSLHHGRQVRPRWDP